MHASLANTRQRPVETMLRMMIPVTNYFSKERPGTVYNIRDLFSSQSGFVVPDRCEAWLDVHLPPDAPDESVSFSQVSSSGRALRGVGPETALQIAAICRAKGRWRKLTHLDRLDEVRQIREEWAHSER